MRRFIITGDDLPAGKVNAYELEQELNALSEGIGVEAFFDENGATTQIYIHNVPEETTLESIKQACRAHNPTRTDQEDGEKEEIERKQRNVKAAIIELFNDADFMTQLRAAINERV